MEYNTSGLACVHGRRNHRPLSTPATQATSGFVVIFSTLTVIHELAEFNYYTAALIPVTFLKK